jgi:hypothetical protein
MVKIESRSEISAKWRLLHRPAEFRQRWPVHADIVTVANDRRAFRHKFSQNSVSHHNVQHRLLATDQRDLHAKALGNAEALGSY